MKIVSFRKGLFLVFTIAVLLILSSIGSFGTSTYTLDKKDLVQKKDSNLKGKLNWITTTSSPDTTSTVSVQDNRLLAFVNNFLINSDNIVVSNAKGNESYPSCVMEKNNGLVAYEHNVNSETHIYIRNSIDYGHNWSNPIKIIAHHENNLDIEINSPSLSLEPVYEKAYGVCKSPLKNSSVLGLFEIDNISKINNILINTLEFSGFPDQNEPNVTYAFWGFKTPKILTFNSPPWFMVFIGTSNYTVQGKVEPFTNALLFLFEFKLDPEQQGIALGMHPDHQNLSNLSITKYYDSSSKYICGVCETNNDSNQDLFFFKLKIGTLDYNDVFVYKFLTSSEDLIHPQIFVEKNNIYIVADSDSGIVLYKSSDEGNSWDINQVTRDILPTGADPNYPMIYANETHLFCSFIESGNIYLTRSTDYGLSWNDPVQLNTEEGSVVEEYRFGDFPDKYHIFWTDEREGNRDIYSNLLNILPPSAPSIEGPTRGKKGVLYNFTFNSIDPDGDDVFYFINWGDGCTEDWVGPYTSGKILEIAHSFPLEKTFKIEVKAKDTSDFESDWSDFEINIPRTRNSINIIYHWFLERFPLLERLLTLLL
jgi:hypothetical protein